MPWLFLAVCIVGAAFTANALRPTRNHQFIVGSFFAAWLTGELALWHLAWQVVATAVFISLGALDAWPGWVALGITLVSWAGLAWIIAVSLQAAHVVEQALRDGLGPEYLDEIAGQGPRRRPRRTALRRLAIPFLLRHRNVRRVKNVRYADGAGRRHLLDVWHAKGHGDRAPVLLQIHGGGWVIGDKAQQGLPLMLQLAARGWVCVAINYRLSPKATFPDHLVDCKLALAWIREHIGAYGGDPDFVIVTGGSAGGHLAALTALTANDPEYQVGFESVDTTVQACVPFYPPTDLVDLFRFGREKASRIGDRFAKMLMGTTPASDPDGWRNASPVAHVHEGAPAFFVVHGSADNLVPVHQTRAFVAELRAMSAAPVCYAEIPGASHAFEIFHSMRADAAVDGVDRFLAWLEADRSAVPVIRQDRTTFDDRA